jgi:hypothetical protein
MQNTFTFARSPGKVGVGFVPIHLRFLAQGVALRDADLFGSATERAFLPRDVPSDRRFGNRCLRLLPPNPQVNAMCRVPLLARCTLVGLQSRIDELFHRAQLRLRPLGSLAVRRLSIGQRLPHHSTMYSQFPCHCPNRSRSVLVLPPDLFE